MSWDTNLNTAGDKERAKSYRARAAELRAVAEWMKEPAAVSQITATALEYERMAVSIETFGKTKAKVRAGLAPPAS